MNIPPVGESFQIYSVHISGKYIYATPSTPHKLPKKVCSPTKSFFGKKILTLYFRGRSTSRVTRMRSTSRVTSKTALKSSKNFLGLFQEVSPWKACQKFKTISSITYKYASQSYFTLLHGVPSLSRQSTSVMFCAIWYHLYNLKNVKNIHEEVLLLVKLQA